LKRIAKGSLRLWGCLSILIVLIAAVAVARAGDSIPVRKIAVLTFDPTTTEIDYSLNGWPHHTQGTFKLRRGVIGIDPTSGRMEGEIVVDASSGNSNESVRDERMSSSILEAGRFPDIIFKPSAASGNGKSSGEFKADVSGTMVLHGGCHSINVVVLIRRDGDIVHLESGFDIPFVAWGLEDPSILMFKVEKEVHVRIIAASRLSWMAQPSRRP